VLFKVNYDLYRVRFSNIDANHGIVLLCDSAMRGRHLCTGLARLHYNRRGTVCV